MALNPLDDRVVIQPLDAEETTAGGIVLPDAAREKPQRGTVTAVGPGLLLSNGKRGPMQCKVDDIVVFPKYGAKKFEVNEEEHFIINEQEVLTIVEEE